MSYYLRSEYQFKCLSARELEEIDKALSNAVACLDRAAIWLTSMTTEGLYSEITKKACEISALARRARAYEAMARAKENEFEEVKVPELKKEPPELELAESETEIKEEPVSEE